MPLDLTKLCPDSLFGGGCTVPACPRSNYHAAKFCELCAAICFSPAAYSAHLGGSGHRKKTVGGSKATPRTWVHCPVCDIQVLGPDVWQDHILGGPHARRSASSGVAPDDVQPESPPSNLYKQCALCKEAVPNRHWSRHLSHASHKRREELALLRSTFDRSEQDKHGITVSHGESGLDFGIVSPEKAIGGVEKNVTVSTTGPSRFFVASVEIARSAGHTFSPFSVATPSKKLVKEVQIPVRFAHSQRGRFEARVEIVCQVEGATSRTVLITRTLRGVIGEAAERELLKPIKQYVRRRRAPWRKSSTVVSGDRPPALMATPWVRKLTRARIPKDLADVVAKRTPQEVVAFVQQKYMQSTTTATRGNHAMFFRALLWIEEVRAVEDLHMYDMTDVKFVKEGSLFTLPVEGLSEKRPSVVVGDAIHVQEANATAGRTHEGFVHTVRVDNVRLSFHRSFNAAGKKFNVCFQFNRVPLRRQHQALTVATPAHQRLLFPTPTQAGLQRALGDAESPLTLFNKLIGTNPAQLKAVKSIVNLGEGTAPFAIFGPPGTGKTVTLVESARQILHRQPSAKVLACAPSNSAADQIAKAFIDLTTAEMFRCNAASRDPASLDATLVPYTLHQGDHYGLPPRDTLMSYRLTVTTCGNASFAHNMGIPQGHYTHIIVDESGQASEPEVLTAIKAMTGSKTIVILAGDPKQLGPVIRSSIARELGLGKSYLERLLELPLYSSPTGRGTSYIKLVKNYRSHGAILRYPNEQFYEGELEVCGPNAEINYFIGSSQLVSPKFPVVFHAISGLNEREASSPSYFNIDEASQVKAYCQAILADASYPVQPTDIAVVTQYHAQVLKIRKLLREAGLHGILVTSVENIQGQERPVIIISTVRSSRDLLSYDAKFTLGFVSNPRRFNVAVTRAKALLIVVGDPTVLSIDPLWRGFMNYIYRSGGWRGEEPSWDVDAPVKTTGDYADEIREEAATAMNAFMARLEEGDDLEGGANFDAPFQEAD